MISRVVRLLLVLGIAGSGILAFAAPERKHLLAFYSTNVEADHVAFAQQALKFYAEQSKKEDFVFESTTHWDDLNAERLKSVSVVLWLDDFPHSGAQQLAFENYMKSGGGWLGFHVAAYNDADTHWPWFVDFLGGAVFYGNNWPPLPALLDVDHSTSAITRDLPARFTSPANEWYSWKPDPRLSPDVEVLLTLDASNYPLGFKDLLTSGDVPVVWRNKKYRMIYANMGHGDRVFSDSAQNIFFEDALRWLIRPDKSR